MNIEDLEGLDTPGPGAYDVGSSIGTGLSFTLKGRVTGDPIGVPVMPNTLSLGATAKQRQLVGTTPGPATYSLPNRTGRDSPSFSLAGRQHDGVKFDQPGPGAYSPKVDFTRPSLGAATLHGRTNLPQLGAMGQVGPVKGSSDPGPGAYRPEDERAFGKTGRMSSLAGRTPMMPLESSPGPGAYEVTGSRLPDRAGSPSFSFAGRTQVAPAGTASPGPGAYMVSAEACAKAAGRSASPSFSLGGRLPDSSLRGAKDAVGPGRYNVGSKVFGDGGRSSPSFSLAGRPNRADNRSILANPAPGHYNVPSTIGTGRCATLAGRTKPGRLDIIPGPGAYNRVDDGYRATRPNLPLYTLKSRTNAAPEQARSPGPAHYTLSDDIGKGKPAASLGGRTYVNAIDVTPGPGQYYNPRRSASPSFSLAGRTATAPIDKSMPGPGAYDVRGGQHGPAFSLAGRPKKRGVIVH